MIMMGEGGWWSVLRQDEQANPPKIDRTLLRRVAAYAWPYAPRIAGMLAIILATSLLHLIPPLILRDLLDVAIPQQDAQRLNLLALGMVAVPLLNGVLGVAQRYISSSIGEGVIYDLRCAVFEHLQRMSLRFFTNTRSGELMSRLNNDVVGAQQAVTGTLVTILSNSFTVATTLAIMLSLEWRLTILAILVLPLFIFPAQRVAVILRQLRRESMQINGQMSALMAETLNVSGALLVKLFGRAQHENRRFGERAVQVRDIGVRQAVVGRWFFTGLSLVGAVGTALVFWLGGHLVLAGEFTIGTIVAFGAYLSQLYGPLMGLFNARVELATSLVSFERVFEVLDLPEDIQERPGATRLDDVSGHVQFERVSFSYQESADTPAGAAKLREVQRWSRRGMAAAPLSGAPPPNGEQQDGERDGRVAKRRWALRDVAFEIQPGQLAALVGPSGAGKTTLTYLLPRLYDPTDGRVLIDGHGLRDLTLSSLSANIGVVTQESYLFHDTIRANLLYAKSSATQAELEAACRSANIHDFIASLPDGYDTVVGERGYRLSGGEKQRVAIARVILKDPQILVLDEATSHLDSESEALIQDALEGLMHRRTSLVIAHRLSTILKADVILVLDRGRLVERGTHQELLASNGLYARLYRTQFRGLLAEAGRK